MKVLGVTIVKTLRQSNQRLSHSRGQARWIASPAGLESPFLIEGELLAQEEILSCERAFGSQTENHEVQQIGQQLPPKQAGFHHGPMVLDFGLPLKIGRTLARFNSRR
jgi:hypothetical protein